MRSSTAAKLCYLTIAVIVCVGGFLCGLTYERHKLQPQLNAVIQLGATSQANAYVYRMRSEQLNAVASDCLADREAMRTQFAASLRGDWFVYKPRPGDNVNVVHRLPVDATGK